MRGATKLDKLISMTTAAKRCAAVLRAKPKWARAALLAWRTPPCPLFLGGATTYHSVVSMPFGYAQKKEATVLWPKTVVPDPLDETSNGFGDDVLCVQLEEDSFEGRAQIDAEISRTLVG